MSLSQNIPSLSHFVPFCPPKNSNDARIAWTNRDKLTHFWDKLGQTQNSPGLLKPLYL